MECKFYNRCGYADVKAFMCTEKGGGNYCGTFRALCTEPASKAQANTCKQNIGCPGKA